MTADAVEFVNTSVPSVLPLPSHADSDIPTTYTTPPIAPLIKQHVNSTSSVSVIDSFRREYEVLLLFCVAHVCVGFSMGAVSPAMESITHHFGLNETWRGLLGASALAGNILGSPMGGFVADKWGRRRCMLLAWIVFALAAGAQGLANSILILCVFRAVLGWSVGAHYAGTTAYLSEALPGDRCGRLLAIVEAHFFLGNFLSIGAGAFFRTAVQSEDLQWRLMLACCALPVLVTILLFAWRAPETRTWTLTRRVTTVTTQTTGLPLGDSTPPTQRPPSSFINILPPRVHSAPPTCKMLAGNRAVFVYGRRLVIDDDYHPPESSCSSTSSTIQRPYEEMSTASSIFFVSVFWGTLILPTYAVSAFAVAIISDLGLSLDPFLLNTYLGAAAALGVFVGVALVDRIGRKPLLLLSQWGVAAAFLLLAAVKPRQSQATYLQASVLVAAFLAFELLNGAGSPLALVYPAEIFPSRIKGMASGVSAMNSRIIAVVGIFAMSMSLAKTGVAGTMIGLAILSSAGAIITHLMSPRRRLPTAASSSSMRFEAAHNSITVSI